MNWGMKSGCVSVLLLLSGLALQVCSAQTNDITANEKAAFYVVWATMYKDGGTTAFVCTNASTNKLVFCFDRQINTPTWGQFYLNGKHRTKEGVGLVAMNSPTEKELVSLLRTWIDKHFTAEEQAELSKERLFSGEIRGVNAKLILDVFKSYERRDEIRAMLKDQALHPGTNGKIKKKVSR